MIRIKIPFLERSGRTNFVETLKTAIFIGATTLFLIAAARNTLTWHLQQFWGASANFWEALWGKTCDLFGDEASLGSYGFSLYFFATFWSLNLFFLMVDFLQWPSFILRYKIQPTQSFKMSEFWRAVRNVLFNQTVIAFPIFCINYQVMKWRGCSFDRDLPTFQYVLFEIACFGIIEEIGFYYTHRLVHTPLLYKHIHKKHHEWTAPVGIVSIYAHPIEFIVSNLFPVGLGPWIMGSHCATYWLWIAIALFATTISHCGYHLPFLPSPEMHDFHHLKFTNCFGVLGILDRLHGTDDQFRKSKQYDRHYIYFGLTPPRELVPDEQNKKTFIPDDKNRSAVAAEGLKTK